MKGQISRKPLSTKIIQVYKNKSTTINCKDTRERLIFKVKPEKAKSQVLITYKDLKKNFPYALLDYYESKLKMKVNKQGFNDLVSINEENVGKVKDSKEPKSKRKIVQEKHQKQNQKLQSKENDKISKDKQQKYKSQQKQQENHDKLILDYDNIESRRLKFECVFPKLQGTENPYIIELNDYQNYRSGLQYYSEDEELDTPVENKRKKPKY